MDYQSALQGEKINSLNQGVKAILQKADSVSLRGVFMCLVDCRKCVLKIRVCGNLKTLITFILLFGIFFCQMLQVRCKIQFQQRLQTVMRWRLNSWNLKRTNEEGNTTNFERLIEKIIQLVYTCIIMPRIDIRRYVLETMNDMK